jgi:hypothetical protein
MLLVRNYPFNECRWLGLSLAWATCFRMNRSRPAELILLEVLKFLLSQPTKGLPILLIAGARPGSGKLTASLNPLLALRKEILCSYDVSNHSLDDLQELLNQLHGRTPITLRSFAR